MAYIRLSISSAPLECIISPFWNGNINSDFCQPMNPKVVWPRYELLAAVWHLLDVFKQSDGLMPEQVRQIAFEVDIVAIDCSWKLSLTNPISAEQTEGFPTQPACARFRTSQRKQTYRVNHKSQSDFA